MNILDRCLKGRVNKITNIVVNIRYVINLNWGASAPVMVFTVGETVLKIDYVVNVLVKS